MLEATICIGGIAVFAFVIAFALKGVFGIIIALCFFSFFGSKILEAYSDTTGIKSE